MGNDLRIDNINSFRRVFIIGAGASADAFVAIGKDLFREAMLTALKESTDSLGFKNMVQTVINRLKNIYPNFEYSNVNTWPNYEEYFDLIYDFVKANKEQNIVLPNSLLGLKKGIDSEAMKILYWYFYTACSRWAGKMSMEYLFEFVAAETNPDVDALISMNYEWLFERCYLAMRKPLRSNPENARRFFYDFENGVVTTEDMNYCYGPDAKFTVFKPHGSINWMIGPINEVLIYKTTKGDVTHHIGSDELPIIYKDSDIEKCVYLSRPFHHYEGFYDKGYIMAIVPPQGIKGYTNPRASLSGYGEKDIEHTDEYRLLKDLLTYEIDGSIKAIHMAKEEIWLVGTTLLYDMYLLNQVRLKRLSNSKIVIKLITPDRNAAHNLSGLLGEILFYEGTMKKYSEKLKYLNEHNNEQPWTGLQESDFERIKVK